MTPTQREAMQQALEAMNHGITEMNLRGCGIECMPLHYAAKALREALAEPEPYDQQALDLCEVCGWKAYTPFDGCFICKKKTLAEPVVEPVAWLFAEWSGTGVQQLTFDGPPAEPSVRDGLTNPVWIPLYAAPQPAEVPILPDVCPFCEAGKTYSIRKCRACGSESVPGCLHDQNADKMPFQVFARAIEQAVKIK